MREKGMKHHSKFQNTKPLCKFYISTSRGVCVHVNLLSVFNIYINKYNFHTEMMFYGSIHTY